MSKRTAKFVSAIFVSLLAGTALVTAAHGAPVEPDKCLSGPKGAPPAGGHWYYRVDRATKRACWYIGNAREKLARAAPETSPTANSVSPPNNAGAQLSIANARAEFPQAQSRRAPEATAALTAPPAAEAASPTGNRHANAEDANAQRSVVASRWFEPTNMAWSAPSQPPVGHSDEKPPAISQAAPPAAAAAFRLAAADARPSGSVQQLLIAIVGALALAGLLASAIFRLSGTRWTGRRGRAINISRRVNWDLADPRPASDPNERIAQMLTRLARSAAT